MLEERSLYGLVCRVVRNDAVEIVGFLNGLARRTEDEAPIGCGLESKRKVRANVLVEDTDAYDVPGIDVVLRG